MVKNTRTPHLAGGALLAMLAAALLAGRACAVGGLAQGRRRIPRDRRPSAVCRRLARAGHGRPRLRRSRRRADRRRDDAGRVRFTADSAHHKPVRGHRLHARREGLPPRRRPRHGDRRRPALPAAVRPPPRRSPVAAGAPASGRPPRGTGRQAVQWDAKDGSWSVVVMNADGSPGVAADVDAGAKAPFLRAAGWGAIGAALLPLLAAGWLVGRGAPRLSARLV